MMRVRGADLKPNRQITRWMRSRRAVFLLLALAYLCVEAYYFAHKLGWLS